MQVYFLDNEDYFHRKFVFHNENNEFFRDNDERTIFFCKGALETVKKLGWSPDIIHCQGWMTSLIPLYLKTIYKDEPVFKNSKVVYSVFDKEFDDQFGQDFARKASLNHIDNKQMACFEEANFESLAICGINHADGVVKCAKCLPQNVEKHMAAMAGKPILEHCEDTFVESYHDFYNTLLTAEAH